MKKIYILTFAIFTSFLGLSQIQGPTTQGGGQAPNWSSPQTKAVGDSCGFYHNQYIPLNKTSTLYFEPMRTGNGSEQTEYNGRAQRFTASQPIEIMGVQFFGFETNPLVDSVMAITAIHEYLSGTDEVGPEIIRDTVWVKHQAFTALLPDVEVNSVFDSTITVTTDYIVAITTPTDDSLKIYASDRFVNDGANEGVSFILYENPIAFPGFYQWYNVLTTFGASYDYDYLINPLIKYDLHDEFTILDDTICPGVVSGGCVTYAQSPVYGDVHYNGYAATQTDHILWLWGDGFQNTNLFSACHTYNNSGDYNIELKDTLRRHNFNSPFCVTEVTMPIHVIDEVVASFTFSQSGTIVDFSSTSATADSLVWDFGDSTMVSDSINVQHTYDSVATYDVWLYAYNECGVDSVMMQVTTDDVGLESYNFDFKLFPNPANNLTNVVGLTEGTEVELINIVGKTVYAEVVNGTQVELNLNDYSSGTYFIKVSSDKNQLTKKLVIRH